MFDYFKRWWAEAKYIYENDKAAHSVLEVYLLYPGLRALRRHERAHKLYINKKYFRARLKSEITKFLTGIEIHPGAKIGKNVMIDHGHGIVIGETAIVGDRVKIFQGVSLAADDYEREDGRRHPKVGNDVLLGAGCLVIGPHTIGDFAKIGAGAVLMRDVPSGATAVGVPARIIENK